MLMLPPPLWKPSGGAGYRYWRLNMNAAAHTSISSVKFYQGGVLKSPVNMTDNSTPSPNVVSSVGKLSASYEEWESFDGDLTTSGWISLKNTAGDRWLQWDAGAGNELLADELRIAHYNHPSQHPTGIVINASNDGVSFDEQHDVGDVSTGWTSGVERTFTW